MLGGSPKERSVAGRADAQFPLPAFPLAPPNSGYPASAGFQVGKRPCRIFPTAFPYCAPRPRFGYGLGVSAFRYSAKLSRILAAGIPAGLLLVYLCFGRMPENSSGFLRIFRNKSGRKTFSHKELGKLGGFRLG